MAASTGDVCLTDYTYLFRPDLMRGKVAFITGGGSGIGFTIAEILMRHQCDTIIASRNAERVQTAAQRLQQATGRKCLPLQMDVRKPQEIIKAVDAALAKFERIDVLVNNAAGNFLSPISGLSFNAFKTVLEIDTMGTFNVSKVVYEKFMKDHGGVIVNISATLHYRGTVLQNHASCAKAGVDTMTKIMAVEWGPQGIRTVGIAPGPIGDTEGMRRLGGREMSARRSLVEDYIPLGRLGTRADIAHTALFLVSEAGSLITGETVVADGGAWLSSGNSMKEAMRRMSAHQGPPAKSRM